jgi:hypothetical protein
MDQDNKPRDYLPRVWGGENVSPPQLMNLYTMASHGEITAHLVGLNGLTKIFTVFTEIGAESENPYNPSSRPQALEAVASRKRIDVTTTRYLGALVGEEITHAKERARKRLIEHGGI